MRVNLTKKEIINSVFMQIGFSKKMSESILEDILSDIVKNLKRYKVVKISNFGTFHIRFKKSRVGRNPKTKEEKASYFFKFIDIAYGISKTPGT